MEILKLIPSCKDYLWGGDRLIREYGKKTEKEILAETWELSCHSNGESIIQNGEYAGRTLRDYVEKSGGNVLGEHCLRFSDFPILIKLIDAREPLSIQVHPDNDYALRHEGQYGKTEMWYVVDAKEDAFLYHGFKKEISGEELRRRIADGSLTDVLRAVPVKKGDVFFIEPGTVHAIGGNILIAEIQQNSNVTYRVYDYDRVGADGKKRELHIEQALDVVKRDVPGRHQPPDPYIAACEYFCVERLELDGIKTSRMCGCVDDGSFLSVLILDGEGQIGNGETCVSYRKGDSLFLPAGFGNYEINGRCEALLTRIPPQKKFRIGVDIGGTSAKIGVIDGDDRIVAKTSVSTGVERPETTIERIADGVRQLLEEMQLSPTQCDRIGIGVPGFVDPDDGIVLYSNNLQWENVYLADEMQKRIPLPVYMANDADCAALGEATAGAGKGTSHFVMLTLGTGVGGGVIVDGKLFRGGMTGGIEPGHMVVCADGELCTCGRRGCLEAYASATALRRESKKMLGEQLEPLEIFHRAQSGDEKAQKLVETYIDTLGTGIVNLVNLFRPEKIVLGGGIAAQGERLTRPLDERVQREVFGGVYAKCPAIVCAQLGNRAGMIGAANLGPENERGLRR